MHHPSTPLASKVAATYDAAADLFDAPQLGFWARHGRSTVERLALKPGSRVLDVGCGTGSSALPAAQRVGPDGCVLGVDLSENMILRARRKAAALGLVNTTFAVADMTEAERLGDGFDAVISVFSVFFVPDVERQIERLRCLLRPGGSLAVTVWGPNAFEPAVSLFREELHRFRPDLLTGMRPWERYTEPEALTRLFSDTGASEPSVAQLPDRQPLVEPDDFWTIAMGSGFRWEIEQLSRDQRATLRGRLRERIRSQAVTEIETSALIAVSRRSLADVASSKVA